MIQQHHILRHASKQHQFCLSFGRNVPYFCPSWTKKWYGWAQMGTQELVSHCIIIHWTHMEDME